MAAHPSRSGAISAELFAAILDEMQTVNCDEAPDGLSRDYLKHRIMDAALWVAVRRAARKFGWARDFAPSLDVDSPGNT